MYAPVDRRIVKVLLWLAVKCENATDSIDYKHKWCIAMAATTCVATPQQSTNQYCSLFSHFVLKPFYQCSFRNRELDTKQLVSFPLSLTCFSSVNVKTFSSPLWSNKRALQGELRNVYVISTRIIYHKYDSLWLQYELLKAIVVKYIAKFQFTAVLTRKPAQGHKDNIRLWVEALHLSMRSYRL